jgi:hypothetical protein
MVGSVVHIRFREPLNKSTRDKLQPEGSDVQWPRIYPNEEVRSLQRQWKIAS